MKLHEFIHQLDIKQEIKEIGSSEDQTIRGIADNSSNVEKGFAFVAIKGFKSDGHAFIEQAVENGAAVVIGTEDISGLPVPYIQVKNSRRALGIISSLFYDFPCKEKLLIGVTGTNGKTTTSYLIREIMEYSGMSCALIGSVQNVVNGEVHPASNTTPNALEINQLLSKSEDDVVIIEVSSHALIQHRVEGLAFDYALFTNLTHDHLDYHDSMEEYFEAKKMLFGMLKQDGKAIINANDPWGEQLAAILVSEGKDVLTIGETEDSDVTLDKINFNPPSLTIGETILSTRMFGVHNMYNIAMAYATAMDFGIHEEHMVTAIENFKGVEGRFHMIQKEGVTFVIDYAHTPDALYHCLKTVRECGAEKVFHVFGFRGDRDSTKRQEMVSISSEWSDHYFLTFDDLNTISPEDMTQDLEDLQELYGKAHGQVIPDRTLAIKQASELAEEGDWVLITGKGNEAYKQMYELSSRSDEETVERLSYGSKL